MFWMASFSCTDGMHLIEFSSHTVQACKEHCQFFWIYVVVIIIHYSKLIIFFIYFSVSSKGGCSYLFDIASQIDRERVQTVGAIEYLIDATRSGNVSRYINHR